MDERKDFGNCTKQSQYYDDITDENPDKFLLESCSYFLNNCQAKMYILYSYFHKNVT